MCFICTCKKHKSSKFEAFIEYNMHFGFDFFTMYRGIYFIRRDFLQNSYNFVQNMLLIFVLFILNISFFSAVIIYYVYNQIS